jgi:hypothetical protein
MTLFNPHNHKFIYFYPLKQDWNLKMWRKKKSKSRFLSYIHCKQGLKRRILRWLISSFKFIYILLSLKQGLKPIAELYLPVIIILYPTIIKTDWNLIWGLKNHLLCFFLYSYYPLKQGLKRCGKASIRDINSNIYILLSITTRIETTSLLLVRQLGQRFISYYPIKTRIETAYRIFGIVSPDYLYPTIH